MNKIIECVPNFSEGRDLAKIKQITDAIEAVSGVKLLGVEPGADTNRTVVTFVGNPEAVAEAAFQAISKAAQLIDMSQHQGAHPRMGATDVCPFVPVEGVTMKDCVEIARKVGARVGAELGVPVYLYEEAAATPERRNLADIRRGEYEGLAKKMSSPNWKPDFGPTQFNPKTGATVIGAREFLIAYNITLNSTDKNHAADIAFAIRELGRMGRTGNTNPYYNRGKKKVYAENSFPCASCDLVTKTFDEVVEHCKTVHHYDLKALLAANEIQPDVKAVIGKNPYQPGLFTHCKSISWYVAEYQRSQVSINLTNYKVTPPHLVLEESRKLAQARGLAVTGSEIVGVIPFQALYEAGQFYLERQGKTKGFPTQDVLNAAVFSMGLSDVAPFEIDKKVIGLPVDPPRALVQMTVRAFTDEVSRDTPAPGGGSLAALSGALGAAATSMVANLTYGKENTDDRDPALAKIAESSQKFKDSLLLGVDADTNAFNSFMEARRLPQNTPEEKAHRLQKMQEGMKIAIEVPYQTALSSFETMKLASDVTKIGNPNSITDGAVGLQMGYTGVRGAVWNVMINLKDISDDTYINEMKLKCTELLAKARTLLDEGGVYVDAKLLEMVEKSQQKRIK
jgi:glutamate formiminotransferase/formiminotetrahydrofolate cyclodeaminase